TTGELATLTQAADFAFIGKSMPPNVGGQSPLDCAAAAVAMVYGPNMTNFRQMCKSLEECEAAVKTQNPQEALSSLRKIAEDSALRAKLSKNAKTWHSANLGASQRSFDIIDSALRQLENPEK
ncbi:MAG: hypothetical protein J6P03_04360, partial [Opitutales bacterium]|nr:hypothetical protein [Opitutales bacterium]